MTQRILVTGATGFLGRHCLRELRAQGHSVVALVRSKQEWDAQDWLAEVPGVEVLEGSALFPDAWTGAALAQDVQSVFHLAAMVSHSRHEPSDMVRFNVEGTVNMVRFAAAQKARTIFVSTSGTVGCFRHPDMTADEQAPYVTRTVSRWPYYASKVRAEQLATEAATKLGAELVIVRPPVLLGPGDHRHRSTKHVTNLMDGKIPFLGRGGMHFTDVRDVAKAMRRLATLKNPKRVYHFPGTASSLIQFFTMVGEVSGVALPTLHLPAWVALGATRVNANVAGLANKPPPKFLPDPVVVEMSMHYWGLSSLWSHADLGYVPRLPRQTLVDTVDWVRRVRAGHIVRAA